MMNTLQEWIMFVELLALLFVLGLIMRDAGKI
jgi:hypothetical protein